MIDDGGFEIGHADETPAGGDHGVDQCGFGGSGRVVLSVKRFDESLETSGTFALENEAFGEEFMARGIPRNHGFTDGGLGSGGLGRVGAIGRDLFFGCHFLSTISFEIPTL